MYFIKQLRHFWYLIYNNKRTYFLVRKHLIKQRRPTTEAPLYSCIQQVNVYTVWKFLTQESTFSCLTGAKQEYTIL